MDIENKIVKVDNTVDVNVTNFPETQTVDGEVSVSNFPTSVEVSGEVSVSNIPTEISISNLPESQTIDGEVSVSNFPTSIEVSGEVSVSNVPTSIEVTGTVSVDVLPDVTVTSIPAFTTVSYIKKIVYENSFIKYVGKALPDTATSAEEWQISMFVYDDDDNITEILYAEGSSDFTFEMDEYDSYNYS